MRYNLLIFGTRPELIKIIPLIFEIRKRNWDANYKLLYTGQHKELVVDLLDLFNIEPDISLNIMKNGQDIVDSLSMLIKKLNGYVRKNKNSIRYIIAQGDTTSCFGAAIVSFLNNIPFAHVEAGLRTYDYENPFPEEYFRRIISLSAYIHFAPTVSSYNNLINEGVDKSRVLITGNTIVDAVKIMQENIPDTYKKNKALQTLLVTKNNVLITCHRRENQNSNFEKLASIIQNLAKNNPSMNFIWISHFAPFIKVNIKNEIISSIINIKVIEPVNYFEMFDIYKSTKLIISDSGGIQEEAISFNIPVIVIREKTERPEAVEIGNSIVTGISFTKINQAFNYFKSLNINVKVNPYGDGKAAIRILDFFKDEIKLN